jgi:D-alanine-D-alanine ligase
MDKALFKMILRDAGLPTTPWIVIHAGRWTDDPAPASRAAAELGYPAFCKPARLGSSVGISPVAGPEELDAAVALAIEHDPKVVLERAVEGREVEVGVLGNGEELLISSPGEIVFDADWYDYETKYEPGRARLEIPAELPPSVVATLSEMARRAYLAVECAGLARIDFFVREDGDVMISELNTIPGFTPTSAYTRLMETAGVDYGTLVSRLIDLALARAAEAASYRC